MPHMLICFMMTLKRGFDSSFQADTEFLSSGTLRDFQEEVAYLRGENAQLEEQVRGLSDAKELTM